MAYVITDSCIKDSLCVDVCPTDCIHPKQDEPEFEAATQMYVDPEGCIDCGACVPACTSDSIHALEDVLWHLVLMSQRGRRRVGHEGGDRRRRIRALLGAVSDQVSRLTIGEVSWLVP